ncbi:hypothetical protein BDAP_001636 [Binucleata daphniae]
MQAVNQNNTQIEKRNIAYSNNVNNHKQSELQNSASCKTHHDKKHIDLATTDNNLVESAINDYKCIEPKCFDHKNMNKKNEKPKIERTTKNRKLTCTLKCNKPIKSKETNKKVINRTRKDKITTEKINILLEYMAKKEMTNKKNAENTNKQTPENYSNDNIYAQSNDTLVHNTNDLEEKRYSKSVDYTANITKGKTKNLIDFFNDYSKTKIQNIDFGFTKDNKKKEVNKNLEQENVCKMNDISSKIANMNITNNMYNNNVLNVTNELNINDALDINKLNISNLTDSTNILNVNTNIGNFTKSCINLHACNTKNVPTPHSNITNAELSKLLPGKKVYFGSQKIKEYGGDFYAVLDDFDFYEHSEDEMKVSEHLHECETNVNNSNYNSNYSNTNAEMYINTKNDYSTFCKNEHINVYKNDNDCTSFESSYYKKDFCIKIENIDNDKRTTVMLKNIPNKYTQKMLLDLLDEHHSKTYNFVYLKMDSKNKCNIGYAFINFMNHKVIKSFFIKVDGKGWKKLKSCKIARVNYASIQGFDNLVRKFELCQEGENEEYKPFILHKKDYIEKKDA